jgi:hypothetical protein
VKCQDPAQLEQLFLVHGEESALAYMRERLYQEGYQHITIPHKKERYHLKKQNGQLVMTPMDTETPATQ